MVASEGGQCRIIMRDGVLLPGMTMPVLGPPPPDPHPNPKVQAIRYAWCLKIIGWEAVFGARQPRFQHRRAADHWRDPNAPRRAPVLFDEDDDDE
jgi:hypothetical protein